MPDTATSQTGATALCSKETSREWHTTIMSSDYSQCWRFPPPTHGVQPRYQLSFLVMDYALNARAWHPTAMLQNCRFSMKLLYSEKTKNYRTTVYVVQLLVAQSCQRSIVNFGISFFVAYAIDPCVCATACKEPQSNWHVQYPICLKSANDCTIAQQHAVPNNDQAWRLRRMLKKLRPSDYVVYYNGKLAWPNENLQFSF